jgi:hypothetical protein
MKENQEALTFFTIGEVLQCFIRSPSTLIEESDIVNYLLQELVNQNLVETQQDTSKLLSPDYAQLFQIFDTLQVLGLITRKLDTTCSQKFFTWTGF